jgi:hypothetical protein
LRTISAVARSSSSGIGAAGFRSGGTAPAARFAAITSAASNTRTARCRSSCTA